MGKIMTESRCKAFVQLHIVVPTHESDLNEFAFRERLYRLGKQLEWFTSSSSSYDEKEGDN